MERRGHALQNSELLNPSRICEVGPPLTEQPSKRLPGSATTASTRLTGRAPEELSPLALWHQSPHDCVNTAVCIPAYAGGSAGTQPSPLGFSPKSWLLQTDGYLSIPALS